MLLIQANRQHDISYVSQSGLATFARCPAKFYFEKLERMSKLDRDMTPLFFGRCIHASLYKAYDDPDAAFSIFQHLWHTDPESKKATEDSKRNPERAYQMLTNFYNFHKATKMYRPLDPPSGVVDSTEKYSDYEAPFLIDIGGRYPFYGKIDRFVEWNGEVWPLDYKTSSQLTAHIALMLGQGIQVRGYTLGASQLCGQRCKGLIVELLRISPKNDEVMPHPCYVEPVWLEAFIQWAITQMECINKYNSEGVWPKNVAACSAYDSFGVHSYECPFACLCNQQDWQVNERLFDVQEYDPLKVGDQNGD